MLIALHKNAASTPTTRLALQQASGTDWELGNRCVRRAQMASPQDASHTTHRLQTMLNAAQEELAIYLRT